jgi:hypothetical protein
VKASAPLRGTQSFVGQMGWVFERPSLTALEVGWRWLFGLPFLAACWFCARRILAVFPLDLAGLGTLDPQNPWVAAVQLKNAWTLYEPHLFAALRWLLPEAGLAWVVVSGLGRGLVLRRMEPRLRFRPLNMMVLQAAWLTLFAVTCFGWYRSMGWVATTHITPVGEPDLIGYSMWVIFLSLGFFTAWALISWPLAIAPLLMLLEGRSALSSLAESLLLGRAFAGKLVEINLVMGVVKLALIVVAMVLSAAPLPFSDELGSGALRVVWAVATILYLVAGDYFQVVRLKGFVEFWTIFRGTTDASRSQRDDSVA